MVEYEAQVMISIDLVLRACDTPESIQGPGPWQTQRNASGYRQGSYAVTAFLEDPAVAVRVGEVGEAGIVATLGIQPRAPSAGPRLDWVLVPNRPNCDAAAD